MKNWLLVLFLLAMLISIYNSCKKDDDTHGSIDYTKDEYQAVYDATIILSGNNITEYKIYADGVLTQRGYINYFGDSAAQKIVFARNYNYSRYYYLNNSGYADSSVVYIDYITDTLPLNMVKTYYSYTPEGYLSSAGCNGAWWEIDEPYCGRHLFYQDGKVTNTSIGSVQTYIYSTIVAKCDIFSIYRDFDNELTGKNDEYLIESEKFVGYTGNFTNTASYYYGLNPNGTVKTCLLTRQHEGVSNTGPPSTHKYLYSFTYSFQ